MRLEIDTSDNKKIVVKLGKRQLVRLIEVGETQKLLHFINRMIKKSGSSINRTDGIEVNLGPGSFTGLRVGVAVANALGWALKSPVNGKRVDKGKMALPQYE